MAFTVANVPVAPTVGLTIVGLAPQAIDLTVLGAPGCTVLDSAELVNAQLLSEPIEIVSFAIPNNPAALGANLYVQQAAYAPDQNAFGFVFSNGLELTIGVL